MLRVNEGPVRDVPYNYTWNIIIIVVRPKQAHFLKHDVTVAVHAKLKFPLRFQFCSTFCNVITDHLHLVLSTCPIALALVAVIVGHVGNNIGNQRRKLWL